MLIGEIIRLARIKHWIKNVVVLFPVVFGMRMGDIGSWIFAFAAVLAFCFASSFAYIVNDIRDRESDRAHPAKKDRPLARGTVGVKQAVFASVVFLVLSLFVGISISRLFALVVSIYILLQLAYSFVLKEHVLLDVICIAIGFVLRAAAGAVAICVAISPWLFICMFTFCLFMGFCKRYSEIVMIGDRELVISHRSVLIEYSTQLLTHLITLSAGIAVVAYLFYGLSERTVENFGSNYYVYTLPVVVYAIFRFAMLSMKGAYADPTELILRDRPFQFTVVLWFVLSVLIIRYGRDVGAWVQSLY